MVTSTLTQQEALQRIVQQALVLVGGTQVEGCFSHLALKRGRWLVFTAASTPQLLERLQKEVGDIDLEKKHGTGITGWVAGTGQAENVGDVLQDPRYLLTMRGAGYKLVVLPADSQG